MNKRDVQRLLTSTGYYKLAVDGKAGDGTMKAVAIIERNNSSDYKTAPSKMSKKRRLVAAGQVILNATGYEAGAVDGYAGNDTKNALSAWDFKKANAVREVVLRPALKTFTTRVSRKNIPLQRDMPRFYGTAGRTSGTVRRRLKTITLPFRFRIDYNLKQTTNKLTIHEKVADSLRSALIEVYNHYGASEWRRLGLDRYAGGYNPRRKRGGSSWSTHAYGCAVDFYAGKNGLRTRANKALFARREYKAFLDIMEKHGWLNGGRLWGADFMHFQYARLR